MLSTRATASIMLPDGIAFAKSIRSVDTVTKRFRQNLVAAMKETTSMIAIAFPPNNVSWGLVKNWKTVLHTPVTDNATRSSNVISPPVVQCIYLSLLFSQCYKQKRSAKQLTPSILILFDWNLFIQFFKFIVIDFLGFDFNRFGQVIKYF